MPKKIDPDTRKTQPDLPPLAAPSVSRPMVIDCRGPADLAADKQAPVFAILSGHPDLVLYPGVQPVEKSTWLAYATGHNGIAARVKPAAGADGKTPAPQVIVDPALPRTVADIAELTARTWSTAGLDLLESHEKTLRPRGARAGVAKALADQRRRLARRIKPAPTN